MNLFALLPSHRGTESQRAQWWNIPLSVQEAQEMQALSLGQEKPLDSEMAAHSSILAWKIPWAEEPGRLQSIVLRRAGHAVEKSWLRLSQRGGRGWGPLQRRSTAQLTAARAFRARWVSCWISAAAEKRRVRWCVDLVKDLFNSSRRTDWMIKWAKHIWGTEYLGYCRRNDIESFEIEMVNILQVSAIIKLGLDFYQKKKKSFAYPLDKSTK